MKPLSLVCFTLFCFTLIYSQQPKYANTLLWRISGKGLTKPSYLYGTIHLMDKKVFFLGDSVYSAIDKVEGFAAELDLNSIGMEMINRFMKEEEDKKATEPIKVKDVVSPEIWQRYKNTLAEKFGKKAENITVEDLEDKESSLENEMFRNGEMTTFLDAHLFGLAKKKGKWVGGIEDIDDQEEHINNFRNIEDKIQVALYDEDYYRNSLEWLIKIYLNQQLDSIDASMYREESGAKDYIMIKRNLKMARRMDSLSAFRSMFFAVGAAHLPGDSGVISMLRARGFQVTPVISSKKIDPSKYVLKNSEEAWFPVEIKDSAYFLNMPGIANKFDLLESYGLNTKLFFDISFMKLYMTMSIELGDDRKKLGADSLYNGFKKQYSEKNEDVKEKKIFINGVEGRQLQYKNFYGNFIMQIFLPDLERVVINAIMGFKEQTLVDNDSKKFFQSFVVNKTARKAVQEDVKWTSYINQTQAFSIEFPTKPIEKKDVRSEEGKIVHSYQAVDIRSQIFYGMTISSIKEGLYFSIKDSAHFLALASSMRSRFENVNIIDSSLVSFSGFPACKFLINATSEGTEIELNILSILRGNRNYYLFCLYPPGGNGKISSEKYLGSFKLLPINYEWKTEYSKDKSFSTTSPFPFRSNLSVEETETYANTERMIVYDTLASHSLFIDKFTLPSWYWFDSDTAFLRIRAKRFIEWDDSLMKYQVTIKAKTKEVEFLVTKPQQTIIKKGKIILSGNEVYEVYGYLAQQDLDKAYYKFFDDFKISNESLPFEFSRPKFKELMEIIQKANKKEIEKIKLWWNDLSFTENEFPMLQSLMLKVYPDFDSTYENSLNWKIIQTIKSLDSNNNTVDFVKNNYSLITPANNKIKPLLVTYLSAIKTRESFGLIKQIIADDSYPADLNMYYPVWYYDSLELAATLYPEILKLAASEYLFVHIYRMTSALLDSNLLQKNVLLDYEKQLIYQGNKLIEKKNIDDEVYEYYALPKILGVLNTPASNKLLIQLSKYSDQEMRFQTLIVMLKNNLPVDTRTIYTLATNDEYRYNLFEELRKLKKQSLFPTDYLSQEKLAYSKLYTEYHDEEYPLMITKAGSKTILYKGKQQKVFLYKVFESDGDYYLSEEKDRTYHLAIAGPYSINAKDYYSNHELTGVYWEKEFDIKKLDELLKEYLESLKESKTSSDK